MHAGVELNGKHGIDLLASWVMPRLPRPQKTPKYPSQEKLWPFCELRLVQKVRLALHHGLESSVPHDSRGPDLGGLITEVLEDEKLSESLFYHRDLLSLLYTIQVLLPEPTGGIRPEDGRVFVLDV